MPGDSTTPQASPDASRSGAARRVLVTGGAGFIGSHLVELLLARGDDITIIDNLSTGRLSNLDSVIGRVRMIEADLGVGLEQIAAERFDEVYHLAAAVGVDLVLADPIGSIETNVARTADLLRYCAAAGSPPTLIASSSEVYGKPGTRVFSEDDDAVYGPTTVTRWLYACSKALDEHLALAYHQQKSLPAVVVRFFNTIGPRQVGSYGMVLPRFVRSALTGQPLRVFGDGGQTRSFCDVRDVVGALPTLLAKADAPGRVFNVGSDESISIGALAQLVIAETGSSSAVELVDYTDAYPAGFEDLRHRKPDLTRIKAAVGFEPKIGLAQTIRDLAGAIRAEDAAASQPATGLSPAGEGSG